MKINLLLVGSIIIFLILGCSSSSDSNTANYSLTRNLSNTPSAPESFTPDVPGQIARIRKEGSDETQIRQNIADVDKSITYEHLKKNADKYAGKAWACKGKILQIEENNGQTTALISLDGWGNKNVQVGGNFSTDFVENNQVYVVGYLAGNYSYTSIANWQITVPALAARTMIKPSEVSKYQAQSKKK